MELVSAYGLPLPKLYKVMTKEEADSLLAAGIPYVFTDLPTKTIIRVLMLPVLKKLYPGIKWDEFFKKDIEDVRRNNIVFVDGGYCKQDKEEEFSLEILDDRVADVALSERYFDGAREDICYTPLEEALKDTSASVDPKILIELGLLPSFLGDIEGSIRRNYFNTSWTEGYNKKLGVPLGVFNAAPEAKNLLIVDISGSIPDGISATLLTLLETMRHTCNADVIVTGSTSKFYAADDELPTPQWLRENIGYGNESRRFTNILVEKISGNHYGNVIVFGDWDHPIIVDHLERNENNHVNYKTTQVDNLVCYHTFEEEVPGYGRWAKDLAKNITYDTSWCDFLVRG